jgi:hypothetical protein
MVFANLHSPTEDALAAHKSRVISARYTLDHADEENKKTSYDAYRKACEGQEELLNRNLRGNLLLKLEYLKTYGNLDKPEGSSCPDRMKVIVSSDRSELNFYLNWFRRPVTVMSLGEEGHTYKVGDWKMIMNGGLILHIPTDMSTLDVVGNHGWSVHT